MCYCFCCLCCSRCLCGDGVPGLLKSEMRHQETESCLQELQDQSKGHLVTSQSECISETQHEYTYDHMRIIHDAIAIHFKFKWIWPVAETWNNQFHCLFYCLFHCLFLCLPPWIPHCAPWQRRIADAWSKAATLGGVHAPGPKSTIESGSHLVLALSAVWPDTSK